MVLAESGPWAMPASPKRHQLAEDVVEHVVGDLGTNRAGGGWGCGGGCAGNNSGGGGDGLRQGHGSDGALTSRSTPTGSGVDAGVHHRVPTVRSVRRVRNVRSVGKVRSDIESVGRESLAIRGAGNQECVVSRPGRSRRQHRRHPGPGPAGHQGHIGLVLDLLASGQGQGRTGVPVEEEPDRLGQQLGIGGVPPVDRHVDLIAVEEAGEPGHPPLLIGDGHHGPGHDAEVTEEDHHLVGRRQPEWRTHHQVDQSGDSPTQHHAGNHRHRIARPVDHGGQGQQYHGHLNTPLQPTAQVGKSSCGHTDRGGHSHDRKAQGEVGQRGTGRPAAVRSDQRHQNRTGDQRERITLARRCLPPLSLARTAKR